MKWKKYTIYATVEAEDLISLLLSELGVGGVEIEDHVPLSEAEMSAMYVDIPAETGPDDGHAKLSFYLDGSMDEKSMSDLLGEIREGLSELSERIDVGEARIEEGETDETEWRDSWKEFFEPLSVGKFVIKPSWKELTEKTGEDSGEGGIVLEIDPGSAFGTGSHETTRLCLEAICKYMKPQDAVLDVGTGSGILGIASAMLGARRVAATELDRECLPAIERNLKLNGVDSASFGLIFGNIIHDDETKAAVRSSLGGDADIVVANILAPVAKLLLEPEEADRLLRPGGICILSGILEEQLDDVIAAAAENPHFELLETDILGEWSVCVLRRMGEIEDLILAEKKHLTTRAHEANKADFGKLLVIAGSPGMAGAAFLAGIAAFKTGIGMVRFLGPEENRVILQTLLPEAMYRSLPGENTSLRKTLNENLCWADAIILGPGLSKSEEARDLIRLMFDEDLKEPLSRLRLQVIDADALNIMAEEKLAPFRLSGQEEDGMGENAAVAGTAAGGSEKEGAAGRNSAGKNARIVITPHVAEMKRILRAFSESGGEGPDIPLIKADLPGAASAARDILKVNVVLKDAATAVAMNDGKSYMVDTGSAAVAKAGSGDVLTGFIAGVSAICGWNIEESVPLAVYLHQRAGSIAGGKGIHSLLARDIAYAAPEALKEF